MRAASRRMRWMLVIGLGAWHYDRHRRPRSRQLEPGELEALAVIYAAERQDDANSAVHAIAIVSAGLVYIGVLVTFLAARCTGGHCPHDKVPWAALLAVPLPVVALICFFVVSFGATLLRDVYLRLLERELQARLPSESGLPIPGYHTGAIVALYQAGAPIRIKILNLVAYVGAWLVEVGATAACVVLAFESDPPATWGTLLAIACAGTYGLILALQLWALRVPPPPPKDWPPA